MDLSSHAELCALAQRWLKRNNSAGGHACDIAFSEVWSGVSGEVPDAIGFRRRGFEDGSVVVEVKVTRSDFLNDHKKPHRQSGGLGNWRYYLCPEELIQPDELPPGWGLLWVNQRGHIKPKAGVAAVIKNYGSRTKALQQFWHDSDQERELYIVVRILRQIHSHEEFHARLRHAYREKSRLADRVNRMVREEEVRQRQHRELRHDYYELEERCRQLEAALTKSEAK